MTFEHDRFTMSYHQALDLGIDYRDFEKVERLPTGIDLTAVAGVWGDNRNIRCLFNDTHGKSYMRNIVKRDVAGYTIRELGMDVKLIDVGQVFSL